MGFYLNKAYCLSIDLFDLIPTKMSSVPASSTYAPLAKGALPRPTNVKHTMGIKLKRFAIPYFITLVGCYFGGFYLLHGRHRDRIGEYRRTINPDAMFEEMKEYGIFHSVKASWQQEEE